jgi:hypothetical protein
VATVAAVLETCSGRNAEEERAGGGRREHAREGEKDEREKQRASGRPHPEQEGSRRWHGSAREPQRSSLRLKTK